MPRRLVAQSILLRLRDQQCDGTSLRIDQGNNVARRKSMIERPFAKMGVVKELRAHSKERTPIAIMMKLTKRTEGSLRQKALKLGIGLGHQR
jgi:hypothetical protein